MIFLPEFFLVFLLIQLASSGELYEVYENVDLAATFKSMYFSRSLSVPKQINCILSCNKDDLCLTAVFDKNANRSSLNCHFYNQYGNCRVSVSQVTVFVKHEIEPPATLSTTQTSAPPISCTPISTSYGSSPFLATSSGTPFSVNIADLKSMIVYSDFLLRGFLFTFKTGETATYGYTSCSYSMTRLLLDNKRIIGANIRAGALIDSIQFQIYDTVHMTTTWTAKFGGNGGDLYIYGLSSPATYFEITSISGYVSWDAISSIKIGHLTITC